MWQRNGQNWSPFQSLNVHSQIFSSRYNFIYSVFFKSEPKYILFSPRQGTKGEEQHYPSDSDTFKLSKQVQLMSGKTHIKGLQRYKAPLYKTGDLYAVMMIYMFIISSKT